MEKQNNSRIKRLFPKYFENFTLPDGAKEEEIRVYRACKTKQCDKESFTPTFEEKNYTYQNEDEKNDPSTYSLSTFEKPKDVKRFAVTNSEYRKPHKIAVGITSSECGVVQRTRERTGKRTSHVDWWLYEGSKPYEHFLLIDDFTTYLEDYKKGEK